MTGLTLGSWPGAEADHNRFLPILLEALAAQNVRIASFPDSLDVDLSGLDALLIHWPDKVFWETRTGPAAAARMLRLLARLATRPRSTRLVWMVHDLVPHDGGRFKRRAWPPYAAALARLVDGSLTLAEGTRDTVRAACPALARKPMGYIWHPSYPGEVLSPQARAAARAALGWTDAERVYGYCGQLRPYKGVEDLLAAFTGLTDPDARLLIAGRPRDAAIAETLQRRAGGDTRIHLKLEDLSAEAFRTCLGACDHVVAPFRRYLHSGSIVHALSAERPVLTPATPFATSLAGALGSPDWLQTYDGALTPATLAAARRPETPLDLSPLAPEHAARRLRRFLEELSVPAAAEAPVAAASVADTEETAPYRTAAK
jgi:glycosyltransferase involved in cell wall biosynthesis